MNEHWLRNSTIIQSEGGLFWGGSVSHLGLREKWHECPSEDGVFLASRPNAVRHARKMLPSLSDGTRLFLVSNYGFEDEAREVMLPNGDVVEAKRGW